MASGCGKLVGLGVGLLAVAWVVGGALQKSDERQTVQRLASQPAVTVTVGEVLDAYAANEIAAKDRFEGRVLEVSGRIDMITDGLGGDPIVYIAEAKGDRSMVAGLLSDERQAAAMLVKGEMVTVRCAKINAKLTAPTLLDCRLPVPANQYQ